MATANDVDADLITCGVCLNEYHEEAEISTLFPHHCLPCLLVIILFHFPILLFKI